ncbi:MAG: helix-turn-helix domain-containing protein [Syntrophorhabdaceae bacterium]
MTKETWKDLELPNYGIIKVSNTGKVYSYKAKKELYQRRNDDGYLSIRIKDLDYSDKEYKIHRLVAMAFIPNPENKPEVNHKDGLRDKNYEDNLEWVTRSENTKHKFTIGNDSNEGIRNPNARLNEDEVRNIRRLYANGMSVYKIAKLYGRGWQTINHIIKGTTWSHLK